MIPIKELTNRAIVLLRQLISTPSISGEEEQTAALIRAFLEEEGIQVEQLHNNIYARNFHFRPDKPTLLLNSHHDTVKPNHSWTRDPFNPKLEDGKIYGLGSNDAGASLVSLLTVFRYLYKKPDLSHNLIVAATAEEESSGVRGIRSVLPVIGPLDLAIVGEPTGMQLAIAEKGLIVLRCQARGVSGHAARNIGENAILKALPDVQWFSTYQFPKESKMLGPVKMSVTMIEAGTQHNVIPDRCDFTVDIRTTDTYRHEEILQTIRENILSHFATPALDLSPSSIPENHPLLTAAGALGIRTFGSPTLSDQTFITAPSVKIGPGLSERSHTADEFIFENELEQGISIYLNLLEKLLNNRIKW
jgi:acetylornithine deacetylase